MALWRRGAGSDGTDEKKKAKTPKSTGEQFVELVVIVVVAVGLALGIQAFLVKPYRIPTESMVPTLKVGQRVLVNRIGSHFGDPSIGDIVVFHPPKTATGNEDVTGKGPNGQCGVEPAAGQPCPTEYPERSKENFIKRVVAGPGDTVAIRDGHVILNGKEQKEPFIAPCDQGADCTYSTPVKVPPDHWFMMGDNRGVSDDSRYWGPIPKKWIIGGAFATYWPPNRINIF